MNNSVLKRDFKAVALDDEVTLDRRVFHTCAAATGKTQPPKVAQRTRGMMRSTPSAATVDTPCQPHDELRDTTVPHY